MNTVLHTAGPADAMDRIYRHQRYIYDLTRRYYLLGRDEMIEALDPPAHGSVLEIGCGTARNLLKVADRYPGIRLYGLDISTEMLKTAARSLAASRHGERIALATADAKSFDPSALFGVGAFDRIFVSYALSMIPGYADVIEGAIDQLGPGGALHIVDFGRMDRMPVSARRAMTGWLQRFSVAPRRDLAQTVSEIAQRSGLHCQFRESPMGYTAHVVLRRSA